MKLKHHDFDESEIKPRKKIITKYVVIGVAVVVVVVAIILLVSLIGKSNSSMSVKGGLSVKLIDQSIDSNDTTFILVGVKNNKDATFEGKIRFSADDPQNVVIKYEEPSLLSFRLLSDESVVRRLEVTGFSKAIRTDYEIKIELLGNDNSVVDEEKVILSVKN